MSEPIVFISKHRIREGMLEELKLYNNEVIPKIAAEKPGTVFQFVYLNEEGSIISFVHVFPNADAMDDHMIGVVERGQRASDFLIPLSMEIWGMPSETVVNMFKQIESNGVTVNFLPQVMGGFIRLMPA